jgi:glutaredoxin/glutathione-dependent peroxiredoxin
VMKAWEDASAAGGKIAFLADGNADFAKAIGMDMDGTAFGLGIRSKRYSMVVKDGVVAKMAIEDAPGQAALSGAEAMLSMLS